MMCIRHIRAIFEAGIYPVSAKIIALCIAEHANTDGETWISQKTIAAETGCSVRGVQRQIATLKEADILLQNRGRTMRLNPSLVAGLAQSKPATGDALGHLKPANDCGFGTIPNPPLVTPKPATGDALYREPSEPSFLSKEADPGHDEEPVTYPWDDE